MRAPCADLFVADCHSPEVSKYAAYERSEAGDDLHYRFVEAISLFGCNEGCIPWLLGQNIKLGQNEPFTWHLDVDEVLAEAGMKDRALLIDLKPNNTRKTLSLYKIADVWGYSHSVAAGWRIADRCPRAD